ncbi:MAG: AAA family ATPase, partial [Pseudomonadota bacterium]
MIPLFFNNAGPSVPGLNYMIDPLMRINLPYIERLIAQQRYFVLHAPRQTGKTTCLMALMHHLNKQGHYRALYANIERAQTARNDVKQGMDAVAEAIASAANIYLRDQTLFTWLNTQRQYYAAESLVQALLEYWSQQSTQPAVLFLDEIDALVGDTLISVLRQIRGGYTQRPAAFPISIVLCGVRDVRDYRIKTGGQEIITGGSAFNIKTESLRLGNFTRQEVAALWLQHTGETGQAFAEAIFPELWADTCGQPWLVNALAWELTEKMSHLADRRVPVTLEDYRTAREKLIQSRATHLDQLTDKLKEPRIHHVMSAILSGADDESDIPADDIQYVADLGLITARPDTQIANRIYQEVIPRELIWSKQTR